MASMKRLAMPLAAVFSRVNGPCQSDALGELIFAIGVCAFGAAILMRVFRSSTMFQRSLFFALLIPLFSLGVCAVGIDFLHALIPNEDKFGNGIVALMEDGGELLSMLLLMLVAAAQWIALAWMTGLAPTATRA